MSLAYQMMYRLGITPWEHTEPGGPLADLIEGPRALPPGDMLDIGCGTGRDAIYGARHGWAVTGIDAVPRALEHARANARQVGAQVRFLQADITTIGAGELGASYTLLLDGGCLHGLAPAQLRHAAATITGTAKAGATLLMFAFAPGEPTSTTTRPGYSSSRTTAPATAVRPPSTGWPRPTRTRS